jgi:uncharacterized protein YcnI
MKKFIASSSIISVIAVLLLPAVAFAHVVVTPSQVGVAERAIFSVSVPNEKRVAVTSIKLNIPKGVDDVLPTTTSGWTITTSSNHDNVKAVTWTGNIPVGQREDFTFSAQAPAAATNLSWKAYQTYADGTVVRWEQNPANGKDVKNNVGPYSITKVVNDLSSSSAKSDDSNSNTATLAFVFSIVALALSLGNLFLRRKKT